MVSSMDRRLWTAALGFSLGALIWASAAHQRMTRLEAQDRVEEPSMLTATSELFGFGGMADMLGVVGPRGPMGPALGLGEPHRVKLPTSGQQASAAEPASDDGILLLWATCRDDAALTLQGEILVGKTWVPVARVSMNANRSLPSASMSIPVPAGSRWRVTASGGGGKGFAQAAESGAVWFPLDARGQDRDG